RGPETLFFYRPGELLVRASDLGKLTAALDTLGVRFRKQGAGPGDQIVRLLVSTRESVPELLRRLRPYGLGLDQVGPNHVYFAGLTLDDTPWFSGGASSLPVKVDNQTPIPACPGRNAKAKIAVFDSGLLRDYDKLGLWLLHVSTGGNPEDLD